MSDEKIEESAVCQQFSLQCSLTRLVHTDVWGPAPISARNGMRYFLTFMDDFLKKVKDGYEPFLVTTDPDVNVNSEGNSIHLKVRGDIFKFTHAGGNVFIYMNSSPF